MRFYSTNNHALDQSFGAAVVKGLPNDNGLFFPKKIHVLPPEFWAALPELSKEEIGFQMMRPFVDEEFSDSQLQQIIHDTLSFDIPLKKVEERIFSLELYHGPTMAFKDVGARFMSRCLSQLNPADKVVVLVATSGDTGSAVANGFLGVKGIDVVILYPHGKVSRLQEKQFASLGQNIEAIAIDGTFDDCQRLVKTAFLDTSLNEQIQLSSANSINVARWLPQSIYYVLGYQQFLKEGTDPVLAVPSGNFGNITAGMMAWKMGLPVKKWIIANNLNRVVLDYLSTGDYLPKKSILTAANAMDVGDPSNFSRLLEICQLSDIDPAILLTGYSYSDEEIISAMQDCKSENDYLLDPHGATGYLALKEVLEPEESGIFLETAHPAKFMRVVERALGEKIELPPNLARFKNRQVNAIHLEAGYDSFKEFLLANHSSHN